jgi:iron complex outermembrane receptor protein
MKSMNQGGQMQDQLPKMKLRPVAAACVIALMAAAGTAYGQAADPAKDEKAAKEAKEKAAKGQEVADLGVVKVSGIRRGIEAAISVKKNASSIVEAISAEDIGKLPDTSIAESIARLPGLTAQRVAGKAQAISIRGLSPDFSTALLNGREQASSGDNRSVEFDQFPSELVSSVVVYKTPDGLLLGQGLSGTVDIQTARPLNFGKTTFAINVRGEKTGVGTGVEGSGRRFSISYVDQFLDRTLGVSLGYARFQNSGVSARQETYQTDNRNFKFDSATGLVWPAGDWAGKPGTAYESTDGFKFFKEYFDQTRQGLMGVLEFKPNKEFHSVVDLYYSEFDRDVVKRGLEMQVADSWRNDQSNPQMPGLKNPVFKDGKLISGTWTNVNPLSRTIWEPRRDKITAAGWNTKFQVDQSWSLLADLSYSEAKRAEHITEMEAGIVDAAGNKAQSDVTVAGFNNVASISYPTGYSFKLMDPESWGQNGYDKDISIVDSTKAIRLSAVGNVDYGIVTKVEAGLHIGARDKDKTALENKLILKGGASALGAVPAGSGPVDVFGFSALNMNPAGAFPSSYNLVSNMTFPEIFRKSWSVSEKTQTLFSKIDLESELLGMPLTGNVGLQVVNTDQSSTGPSIDLGKEVNTITVGKVVDGKKFTDVLPSLNLSLEAGADQFVRLGLAQTMARARMDQMTAGRQAQVNKDTRTWGGDGGNPRLDPWRADAIDLSFEKYFGKKGYLSAAVFHKNLKSYIYNFTDEAYDFSGFLNLSGIVPTSSVGKFSQPRNGQGGSMSGIEVAASLPLGLLTDTLDGFGLQASFADTKSGIKLPAGKLSNADVGAASSVPLPGLSKQVATFTAYYEKFGFSARVAQRTRSDFLGEISGFGAERNLKFIKAEAVTDLQLGYEIGDGVAKGLSVLVQVNNLTDSKYQEYRDNPNNITNSVKYGKTYLFGLNYKL